MRYAIISDVHANLEALLAVLEVIKGLSADQVVCLGDLVGYYGNPNECIALIQNRGIRCIRGNHDAAAAGLKEPEAFSPTALRAIVWTRECLTTKSRQYLESLPVVQNIDEEFIAVHAALHPQPNDELRIQSEVQARLSLYMMADGGGAPPICFFGHTHRRAAYVLQEGHVSSLMSEVIHLKPGGFYLINPGSAGQAREEDPRASLAVFDSCRQTVQFHQVVYDRALTHAKAIALGLMSRPHMLVRSARWLKHRYKCVT